MRLFVAITPPADALKEVETLTAPLRDAWPDFRWAGQDSWHVTLAFLGEVAEDVIPALEACLERAAHEHLSLRLSISGAGAFPAAARARVLWAGIRGDRQALAVLAGSVGDGARHAGAPPPDGDRPYRPHLTLARCREPTDVRPVVELLAGGRGTPWTAEMIHLIRSNPGSQPRYQAAGAWPLRILP